MKIRQDGYFELREADLEQLAGFEEPVGFDEEETALQWTRHHPQPLCKESHGTSQF